jgi:flagellar biosynthesis protein FlhF
MRLKTYSAKTMKEAMAKVRKELGSDAIIVRSEEGRKVGGARVTAAYEGAPQQKGKPKGDLAALLSQSVASARAEVNNAEFDIGELTAVISYHGIPTDMAMRLQTAATAFDVAGLSEAIASALETTFRFLNMPTESKRPLILVGPTGAGKTVASAKLAAEAVLSKKRVEIITIDTIKSTGLEQLENFARLMNCSVKAAETPEELASLLKNRPEGDRAPDLTIIDSFGVNPFDLADLENLNRFITVGQAEPVLVLPAGMDPMESAEIAEIFASMGARLFIPTKLDAVRRYAGVLTAAQSGGMSIAALGNSPYVADRLEPASPLSMGRLLGNLPRSKIQINQQKRVAQ